MQRAYKKCQDEINKTFLASQKTSKFKVGILMKNGLKFLHLSDILLT